MAQQTRLSFSWFPAGSPDGAQTQRAAQAQTPTARSMLGSSCSGQPFFLAPVAGLANISEMMLSYQATLSA
jgi:hypothetical protein